MPRYHSDTIQQAYTTKRDKEGKEWAKFDDGTVYSPDELQAITGKSSETIKQLHMAKSMMRGTIMDYNKERMDK